MADNTHYCSGHTAQAGDRRAFDHLVRSQRVVQSPMHRLLWNPAAVERMRLKRHLCRCMSAIQAAALHSLWRLCVLQAFVFNIVTGYAVPSALVLLEGGSAASGSRTALGDGERAMAAAQVRAAMDAPSVPVPLHLL